MMDWMFMEKGRNNAIYSGKRKNRRRFGANPRFEVEIPALSSMGTAKLLQHFRIRVKS